VKNKIIIKNNFSKVFLKTKNLKIKNSVISSNLKQITKEIEKKKMCSILLVKVLILTLGRVT
tara:strand:- start:1174 stop:1359 length:186 start_codon:yes stop_codon:yes gene_type:complete